MSTLEVKVVRIEQILPHLNADRLSIATIAGWQCVVGKDQYQVGELAVYLPIDSILPQEVETKLFGPDSKVKLSKGRVKTIKIRGAISQGMLAKFETLGLTPSPENTDLTKELNISKFEPQVNHGVGQVAPASPKNINPDFKRYSQLEHFKKHNKLFQENQDIVVITEKIHGTNFRCGWVPYNPTSMWKKVLKLLRLLPQWEFVYGSHNVQLSNKLLTNGHHEDNVYSSTVVKYNLEELLDYGQVLYGEIYGGKIQKNYSYGLPAGEHDLVAFDLMQNGKYVDWSDLQDFCEETGVPLVPVLYKGPFSAELAASLTSGDSVLAPSQKIREGIVIKSLKEESCYLGRKAVKFVSDEYLLKDNTDFH